jgi:hypothetical protein
MKGEYYEMEHPYGTLSHKHGFKLDEQPSEKVSFGRESEEEVKRIFPRLWIKYEDSQTPAMLHMKVLLLSDAKGKILVGGYLQPARASTMQLPRC